MPIPDTKISRDWIELPPAATVQQVQTRIPHDQRRIRWIVTPVSATEYAVYRVTDLIAYAIDVLHIDAITQRFLNARLEQLGDFLKDHTRAAVEQGADWDKVRDTWDERSDPPLVVLQNGRPIGILKSTVRGGASQVDWIDQTPVSEPQAANGGDHSEAVPPTGSESGTEPGVLEADKDAGAKPARKINVTFEPPEQKDKPLQVGTRYTLIFGVDRVQLVQAIAAADLDEARLFPPNVDEVEMFVQLLSEDFRVLTNPQNLIIPREGESLNRARFDIMPKKNGTGKLTAVFSKDGNAVQAIELVLNVGIETQALAESKTLGRPVEAAGAVKPRAMSLWIDYVGSGFKVSFVGPNEASSFMIPLQLQELELEIGKARKVLQGIVEFQEKGDMVYQVDTTISPTAKNATLPLLARAGFLLFQALFLHAGSPQPAKDFAKRLRDLAKGESLNIQIISKQMMLPWGILYLAERYDANNIDPEMFLGLKHIIEHAPMEPSMDFPTNITSQPQLTVSLNLNKEIDTQMNFPLIKNQQKYWDSKKAKGGVSIITRTSSTELLDALANTATPDQIAYFYCHAVSKSLAEGGAGASTLQFGKNQSVTLEDFVLSAPSDIRMSGSPLVFINACESAELSPLFYNGFMPYFVDKGARGMIGTECPVPALFASEWAGKFFDEFLGGKPLGQIFLDLRRDYFFNHNNILGLLYAVYCDADTAITPGLV